MTVLKMLTLKQQIQLEGLANDIALTYYRRKELTGVTKTEPKVSDIKIRNFYFKDCNFKAGLFTRVTFDNCVFENCNLQEVEFRNCNLIECVFKNCKLSNAEFRGCSLKHTSLIGCDVYRLDFWDTYACGYKESHVHHVTLNGYHVLWYRNENDEVIVAIGCQTKPFKEWKEFMLEDCKRLSGNNAEKWYYFYAPIIKNLVEDTL